MTLEIVKEHQPRKTSTLALRSLLIATLAVLVAGCSPKQAMIVPDLSMAPTLAKGERVIANFRAYHIKDPQVGDIAIFLPRDLEKPNWVLRVAALPGDTISYKNGSLQKNRASIYAPAPLQNQTYRAPAELAEDVALAYPYTLGENEYFFLSDDPNQTSDSRYWGPIDRSEIVGKLARR